MSKTCYFCGANHEDVNTYLVEPETRINWLRTRDYCSFCARKLGYTDSHIIKED